jgi:uncharacterized protein (DUF58 family)
MAEPNKGLIVSVGKGKNKQVIQSGPTVKLQGKAVAPGGNRGIDLVFVIDTTGSMSNKIEGLLNTAQRFVDELGTLGLSHRVGVVAFGDLTVTGDDVRVFGFAKDVAQIKRTLREIPRYSGGANEGESSLEALTKAMTLQFREKVVKAFILITDEPALEHALSVKQVTRQLAQMEILTFVIAPAKAYYQEMAQKTGGKWHEVSAQTDFTDLLDMFKRVATKVSQVVSDVYRMGNGSVKKYLQLKAPEE